MSYCCSFSFSATQVTVNTKEKNVSCNLPPPCNDKQTQTDLTSSDIEKMQLHAAQDIMLDDRSEASDSDVSSAWGPSESDGQSVSSESSDNCNTYHQFKERKYFVFESCLLQLFTLCTVCLSPFLEKSKKLVGSLVKIKTMCIQGHEKIWYSQPMLGDMPMGNFLISASTLFSGCQPAKTLLFFRNMWSPCISERTYNRIQTLYLIPSVNDEWHFLQKSTIEKYGKEIKTIGGDARMDSPGYTAKYGSYSLMDLDTKKIISVQTLQVRF